MRKSAACDACEVHKSAHTKRGPTHTFLSPCAPWRPSAPHGEWSCPLPRVDSPAPHLPSARSPRALRDSTCESQRQGPGLARRGSDCTCHTTGPSPQQSHTMHATTNRRCCATTSSKAHLLSRRRSRAASSKVERSKGSESCELTSETCPGPPRPPACTPLALAPTGTTPALGTVACPPAATPTPATASRGGTKRRISTGRNKPVTARVCGGARSKANRAEGGALQPQTVEGEDHT